MGGQPSSDYGLHATPRPPVYIHTPLRGQFQTPAPSNHTHHTLSVPHTWGPGNPGPFFTPKPLQAYATPMKPYAASPYATLPRTGTIRRTVPRRSVSDREAMKQLVDCVGMSARKKVLESGRKPRIIGVLDSRGANATRRTGSIRTNTKGSASTVKKELRFDKFTTPIPQPDYSAASSKQSGRSQFLLPNPNFNNVKDWDDSDIYVSEDRPDQYPDRYASSESTDSEGGGPPSPSPSPRPGSAMSMMSMTTMSRRSATPTTSGYFGIPGRMRSGSGSVLMPLSDRSITGTTTHSGLLSVPSAGPTNLDFETQNAPSHAPPIVKSDKNRRYSVDSYSARRRTVTRQCSNSWLDEMEMRHATIMQEIEDLEERFSSVTKQL